MMKLLPKILLIFILISTNIFSKTDDSFLPKNLNQHVIDELGILNRNELSSLINIIQTIKAQNGPEIGIVIINSLNGINIEDYTIALAEKWQLGTAQLDNGLILLIAVSDRQMRIEVGNGIEGEITDHEAFRYTNQILPKFFKENQFYEGLNFVLSDIAQKFNISYSSTASNYTAKKYKKNDEKFILFAILCSAILLFSSWFFPNKAIPRGIFSSIFITLVFLPLLLNIVFYIIIFAASFFAGLINLGVIIQALLMSRASRLGRSSGGSFGGFGGGGGSIGGGGGFSGGGSSGRW